MDYRKWWAVASAVAAAVALCVAPLNAADEAKPLRNTGRDILFSDNRKNQVCQMSAEGKIVWQLSIQNPRDVWPLANGNILFSWVRGVKEVTLDKKVVWEYQTEKPNEIHACQPLPDGGVLIGECGTARLIEVDRQGKITKEIKVQATGNPHGQMRLARKTRGGTYLVSLTSQNMVHEYDANGKVLREFKVPGNVYGAVRLKNGNTLLSCGDGHKLIEVDQADKVVWRIEENDLPGNPLRFVAGAQRLANGNTIFCNWGGHGHVGKQPQIVEVTREKKVVWELSDWERFGTISGICLLDGKSDPAKGEIAR